MSVALESVKRRQDGPMVVPYKKTGTLDDLDCQRFPTVSALGFIEVEYSQNFYKLPIHLWTRQGLGDKGILYKTKPLILYTQSALLVTNIIYFDRITGLSRDNRLIFFGYR